MVGWISFITGIRAGRRGINSRFGRCTDGLPIVLVLEFRTLFFAGRTSGPLVENFSWRLDFGGNLRCESVRIVAESETDVVFFSVPKGTMIAKARTFVPAIGVGFHQGVGV